MPPGLELRWAAGAFCPGSMDRPRLGAEVGVWSRGYHIGLSGALGYPKPY